MIYLIWELNLYDILEKNSLKSIIDRGCDPLLEFKEKWSNDNFYKNIDKILT